jgi:hypothetical protein
MLKDKSRIDLRLYKKAENDTQPPPIDEASTPK